MAQELFRSEVLEAQHASWLGEISLAQPVRLGVLMSAAVVVALTVALLLTFGTYTRRSRVIGQLVPSNGLATVLAPATGVVSRLDVLESSAVTAGQILAVVTVQRATLANGDTTAALEQRLIKRQQSLKSAQSAQWQVLDAQANGLAKQLATAHHELTKNLSINSRLLSEPP